MSRSGCSDMSRSGYSDDLEQWALIRWRGAVASSIRGARGQALLKELLAALDAMPEKKLIASELEEDGAVCALGALGKMRGMNMAELDAWDHETVAAEFGIAHALACEIMWENDYGVYRCTLEYRWEHMRRWVQAQIRADENIGAP